MWTLAHAPQPVDEDGAIRGERADQVSEIFSLDDASIFHAADRIVSEREGTFLDVGEPFSKTAEGERVLFSCVDDGDRERGAELRASALGEDGKRRGRDWNGGRGPR